MSVTGSFCNAHGMPVGECSDLHYSPPVATPPVAETVEQAHLRLQALHLRGERCEKCQPKAEGA